MSYHRPNDQYAHPNASQYDQTQQHYQQQGDYRDDPNAANYYDQHQQGAYDMYNNGSQAGYSQAGTPYGTGAGSGAAYKDYSSSAHNLTGGAAAGAPAVNAQKYSYAPAKKPVSKWVKIGLPVLLLIIAIGVGVGLGIGLTRGDDSSAHGSSTSTNGLSGASSGNEQSYAPSNILNAASQAAKSGGGDDLTYQGTDLYGNPSFKASANSGSPSMSGSQVGNCAADNFTPGQGTTTFRPHPRIMTTQAEWDCLPQKIANDAYLTLWNYTIFQNATDLLKMQPTAYDIDGGYGGSGILDPAREVQRRVKALAYAYYISGKDSRYMNRLWTELETAAGNNSDVKWGPGPPEGGIWNAVHFLDLAELTAAFAIGYDWLYNDWTDDQRTKLQWTIVNNGLTYGRYAYNPTDANGGSAYSWWPTTNGNWNCVCNSGLLLGALALGDEDPTGTIAQATIQDTVKNMQGNCMQGVYEDGTWSETPNYWYFGTNAQARAQSALTTALGSDQGLMDANANFVKTGDFHMYVSGNAGMFFYGDHGPNKYSTTANGMFLWGSLSNNPLYGLFQRDRADAAEPLSMFWYDTRTKGGFWNGLALDQYFNNTLGSWASMRSSWTDFSGTYVGIKASEMDQHQTHGDLDAGDFVFDALGTRWAGEFGSANYLSYQYFDSENQAAARWQYYRKGTQGQNTLVINKENMFPGCRPVNSFGTTGAKQSAELSYTPAVDDVAYFKTDLSACYNITQGNTVQANTVQRGVRLLNGRRQLLVRDEIAANGKVTDINWRVHTNATVDISSDGKTATLKITKVTDPNAYGGSYVNPPTLVASLPETQTVIVTLTQPTNAKFQKMTPDQSPDARLYGADPNTGANAVANEEGDQPNPGVTLLYIQLDGGEQQTIETWWQPQWPNLTAADKNTPKDVALASWTTTSHNA